jgi:hypothetical protein
MELERNTREIMALSITWNLNDNAYFGNRWDTVESPFNEGTMCIFEEKWDGKVNRDVAIFAKENGRREGLLYNNRLFFGILKPEQKHKDQYEANRNWIRKNINA